MSGSADVDPRMGLTRCMKCVKGRLGASGQEPYRLVCQDCGQNYFFVVSLQPVPPKQNTPLLPGKLALAE